MEQNPHWPEGSAPPSVKKPAGGAVRQNASSLRTASGKGPALQAVSLLLHGCSHCDQASQVILTLSEVYQGIWQWKW